jgi:NAD(P)-dependent dehydrogenase (short-subunit alcohol dehydrogenase family)
MRLSDKVSIITGGGSGMGRTAALMFAAEGAKVVVADFAADAGEETVRLVREAGGEATFVRTDISSEADAKAMVDTRSRRTDAWTSSTTTPGSCRRRITRSSTRRWTHGTG